MQINKVEQLFLESAKELSKRKLHFHCIQILTEVNNRKFRYYPLGSGVLIQIEGDYLILSAAHVINEIQSQSLFVNTRIGVERLIGSFYFTDIKSDKNSDFGIVKLNKMLALLLCETYEFLPLNKISHSHIPELSPRYMVCGYPANAIWSTEEEVYTGTTHFLLSMSKRKVYEFYSLDFEKNYVLNFGGKGVDLETEINVKKIEDPYGMSGSGLWLLQSNRGQGSPTLEYFLIGIMTMFKKGKYHVLIGNRIDIVMKFLENNLHYHFDWQTLSS